MSLNPAKASPVALFNAAQGLLDKGKYTEAESYLLEVLRRDLNDPAALALMAEVCVAKGMAREALACIMSAVNADPSEQRYKERLLELGEDKAATAYDAMAEQAIMECLKSGETLDCSRIWMLWVSHLFLMPAFQSAFALAGRKAFDPANKAHLDSLSNFSPLLTPFFLLGIRHVVVADALFEEFITHIRKHLLHDRLRAEKKFTPEESLALASALSHYSFHTSYILDCTTEEEKEIETLRTRIESGAETDPANLALFACYDPLYKLGNANHLAGIPDLADVAQKQILDYNALRTAAAGITAVTPIDDAVSARVREQYEEFPYPQWKLMAQESVRRGWKSRNSKFAEGLFDRKINVLSAGCGTGQETVMLSTLFPQAEILAVDLSRSSLAYAARKAEEYGIKNVAFRQADILRLGALDKEFDFISSMGVLHHLQDPVKGWQILCDLLQPGGTMVIGLYSKIARESILKTCEEIKQRGYGAADMKRFRRESPYFLEKPVLADICSCSDYYFMPMYRDLLFHVQEHDYDLAEIEAMLKELKLDFLGFSLRQSVLKAYGKAYPGDPEMVNLQNWRRFEEQNPRTFREMYYLWCRKPLPL